MRAVDVFLVDIPVKSSSIERFGLIVSFITVYVFFDRVGFGLYLSLRLLDHFLLFQLAQLDADLERDV